MTDESKNKAVSWIGSFGSATIVLLSGFIVIGSYKADVDTLKKLTEKMDVQNQVQEQRITKIEACYDNVRETLNEMKVDIKDIKKMTQERRGQP
jgi:hypothetical protein